MTNTPGFFLFCLFLFFVCAVGLLAVALLPEVRSVVTSAISQAWSRCMQWQHRQRSLVSAGARHSSSFLAQEGSALSHWVQQHRKAVLAVALLLLLVPSLAIVLRYHWALDTDDFERIHTQDERVLALLAGEDLRPPPALPPEVFATQEVETIRPMIRYASREWNLLDPVFRQRLLVVFQIMQERHGYELVLLEGYRSPQRQAMLASRGSHVTQAGACKSYHQFGLAADVAFRRNGKIVISERDPWAMRGYQLYGEIGSSLGLTWGGSWKTLKDYGHIELRRKGVLGTDCSNYLAYF